MSTRLDQAGRNIFWHEGGVGRVERERLNGHRAAVLWLTGLSASGKSTIARALELALYRCGVRCYVLDGDNVRHGLNRDLGFSPEDRTENIRRIGEVARLFVDAGTLVLTAFISPYRADRDAARSLFAAGDFLEIHVDAPLEVCEARDPKGLYARARRGEIPEFTGISAPYEAPVAPELVLDTGRESVDEAVSRLLRFLETGGYIAAVPVPVRGTGQVASPASVRVTAGAAAVSGYVRAAGERAADDVAYDPIPPYGGALVDRVLRGDAAAAARDRAVALPSVRLSEQALSDLYLLGVGGYSPLDGFLGREDYEAVLEADRLAGGLPWTVPITLDVDQATATRLRPGDEAALLAEDGALAGLIEVREVFERDREREAAAVYGTMDTAHPGVARLLAAGRTLVAGPVRYLLDRDVSGFPADNLSPAQTRAEFRRRGWRSVVGFQTRNPVHRAHEYLQKVALEIVDGLLLHPLVGQTKADDIPADVRLAAYRTLLDGYYPPERVLLSVLPVAMRYAGPKEAVFHAIIRRNYGCTHFIVGRDHAGVGGYYDTYAAHRTFDAIDPAVLGIQPLRFEHAFHCTRCDQTATTRTCPHGPEHRLVLSGTRVRELLAAGERPPPAFSRPDIAAILVEALREPGA